jgi:C4-type Zn-finger protein
VGGVRKCPRRQSSKRRIVYRLEVTFVRWEGSGSSKYPATFDTVCPHCGKPVNFLTETMNPDPYIDAVSLTARCTRCRNNVNVWSISGGSELYMRPAPVARQPIEGAEMMPTAVRRAYQSTINVYNAGEWDATATQTRVTLEGVVHHLLQEKERKGLVLADQIAKLAETKTTELAQPLITLSNTLREGGNIGAHFDLTRMTDQPTAEAMLDLLDYLIEYLYALPRMIDALAQRIQELDLEADEQGEA